MTQRVLSARGCLSCTNNTLWKGGIYCSRLCCRLGKNKVRILALEIPKVIVPKSREIARTKYLYWKYPPLDNYILQKLDQVLDVILTMLYEKTSVR